MGIFISMNYFALPGDQHHTTGYRPDVCGFVTGEKGDEFMNILKLPGSRVLLIAVIMMGLFIAPVALADVPGALSYGIKGFSGAASAEPAWTTVSGPYAMGSVSAYARGSTQTPSSHLDFSQTVSASGKITSFSFSVHYGG